MNEATGNVGLPQDWKDIVRALMGPELVLRVNDRAVTPTSHFGQALGFVEIVGQWSFFANIFEIDGRLRFDTRVVSLAYIDSDWEVVGVTSRLAEWADILSATEPGGHWSEQGLRALRASCSRALRRMADGLDEVARNQGLIDGE
jgi:hypothetical protein